MPIAATSSPLKETCWCNLFIAFTNSFHHISGSCSAKPACNDCMGISEEGENADAIVLPELISSNVAFTDEEPMSNPNKYFIVYQKRIYNATIIPNTIMIIAMTPGVTLYMLLSICNALPNALPFTSNKLTMIINNDVKKKTHPICIKKGISY